MVVFLRRLLICLALGSLVGLFVPYPTTAQAQDHSSPADPPDRLALHDAVVKFQNAWSIDLSYNAALLEGKWTRWVRPVKASPEEDLKILLQGTGLTSYRLSSGTYGLRPLSDSPRGSLSGYVFDEITGMPLHQAHVRFLDIERGAATGTNGLFALDALPPGRYVVRVSYVGYIAHQEIVTIQPGKHSELYVELRMVPTQLQPLIVDGSRDVDVINPLHDAMGEEALSQISGLGVADIIHSMNDLPGVRVGDATSEVHIQGGDRGEHQFLLDGSLIFEPVHLFGFIGALNPFAISRITIDKAGFSASKGSYLAGVINAEHALTDPDGYPLDVQVDPLSLNGRLNLGFGGEEGLRGAFLGAVRVSMWDDLSSIRSPTIDNLLLSWSEADDFLLRASLFPLSRLNPPFYEGAIQRLDSIPPPAVPDLNFNDVHLAGRLRFKRSHALHTSYYRGGNTLTGRRLVTALDSTVADKISQDPDRYDWVNENGQIQWSFLASSNVFVSMQLRSSRYRLNHEYSGLDRKSATRTIIGNRLFIPTGPTDDGNRIRVTALESTLDYSHRGGYLKTGYVSTLSQHRFTINDVFPRTIDHEGSSWRIAFFAEEKITAIPRVTITAGSRLTYPSELAQVYAEPRLEMTYTAPIRSVGTLSLRGAGGIYYQFLNQFDVSTISPSTLFPSTRFWMPLDGTLPPPKAYHLAGDVGLQFATDWTFHAEGYYKEQPRLFRIDYPSLWQQDEELQDVPLTTQIEFIAPARGYAYGSAFILERAGPALRTSARYEYNMAEREYAFRDSVKMKPVPWNEPHRLEFAVDWTPHPRFIATARWRGGWGRAWGFRRAYYDFLATDVAQGLTFDEFDFREPTDPEHQLDSFQQLDLGIAYTQPIGPTALQLRVDVLNVTDRKNVADLNLVEGPPVDETSSTIDLVAHQRYLLPRTVSISARLKW